MRTPWLDVQDLGNLRSREDLMTSPYPFVQAEPKKECVQIAGTTVGIRCAMEDLQKDGVMHSTILEEVVRPCKLVRFHNNS